MQEEYDKNINSPGRIIPKQAGYDYLRRSKILKNEKS
jgi:hypothetical protein